MGVWSVPYESLEKAQAFKEKMAEPWMAKVNSENEVDAEGVGKSFMDKNCLIGCDGLCDDLADHAYDQPSDFDIRGFIKDNLLFEMNKIDLQPKIKYDLKAYNIIREVLSLEPIPEDRKLEAYQSKMLKVEDLISSNGIELKGRYLELIKKEDSLMIKKMKGLPEDSYDKDVYISSFQLAQDFEEEGLSDVEGALKALDFDINLSVIKMSVKPPGVIQVYYLD